MDPFGGRYAHHSGSDEFRGHRRSPSNGLYDDCFYDPRYGRMPYYHGGMGGHAPYGRRHSQNGCLDRRSKRRLRSWLIFLGSAMLLAILAYRYLGNDVLGAVIARGRKESIALESILDEVIGDGPTRPEMIIPPDVSPAQKQAATLPKQVHEKDIKPAMMMDQPDPLDVPLAKTPAPEAAKVLAAKLEDLNQQASEQRPAALDKKHDDLEALLDTSSSPLNKLNEQIDQLSKKLAEQTQMVEELQRGLERDKTPLTGHQSSMGEDLMKQLGIKSSKSNGEPITASPSNQQSSKEFSRPFTFKQAPVSTVLCQGNDTIDRVCKIKNLCYDPSKDRFFIFKDNGSLEMNVPRNRSYLVDTTSIDGHNKFYFDFNEVHPEAFTHRTVQLVDKLTFMISRFHALNIMHTIHDDFLGLYGLHRMFAPNSDVDERFTFSRDNHILFLEGFESIRYDYVFQFITDNPLQFRPRLKNSTNKMPVCFRDAVVGNSKIGSWYSYGFLEPQGPIANKTVSGLFIRDAARFLMNRMNLPIWDESLMRSSLNELYRRGLQLAKEREGGGSLRPILGQLSTAGEVFITVFSRQLDRLIVNEAELINALQERYGLPVRTVRMEDMHLGQQIAVLRSTAIAIGVHGSALILSIFLPPGALLVELFPYAIPAENYTPYKTMCNLPGMRLAYRSWTNRKAENNFPHPERPAAGGGIAHLPLAEQEKIQNTLTVPAHLCCQDPYWLFRIYQDTRVDLVELFNTIDSGLGDALKNLDKSANDHVFIRPGVIDSVRCSVTMPSGVSLAQLTNSTMLNMKITWDEPWNGVTPEKYGVWIHQPYEEYFSTKTSLLPPPCAYGSRYDIWVRSYVSAPDLGTDLIKSQYSEKFVCHCTPDGLPIKKSADEEL